VKCLVTILCRCTINLVWHAGVFTWSAFLCQEVASSKVSREESPFRVLKKKRGCMFIHTFSVVTRTYAFFVCSKRNGAASLFIFSQRSDANLCFRDREKITRVSTEQSLLQFRLIGVTRLRCLLFLLTIVHGESNRVWAHFLSVSNVEALESGH
jgi:hypothetical protein